MEASEQSDFDFKFGTQSRVELLENAAKTFGSLSSVLGAEAQKPSVVEEAAQRLLRDLGAEVAEFSSFPEIVPLKAKQFETLGMKPPALFTELCRAHRFYWIRFPMTLRPLEDRPFVKLQCAVEFNPGTAAGHLRPVAQMILPDRRFQQLAQAHTSLTLGIGEDFQFKASGSGDMPADGGIGGSVKAGVDVTAAASAGLTAGPFIYTLKKARLNNSGTGTERVFWSLDGAEFFQEQEPVLVVVLRVPNEVKEVRVAAALQASHEFKILAASLSATFAYLSERIRTFFKAGAPTEHTQTWDLTPRL